LRKNRAMWAVLIVLVVTFLGPFVPAHRLVMAPSGSPCHGPSCKYVVDGPALGFVGCEDILASPVYILTQGLVGVAVDIGLKCEGT
jgi:hypothetical protein